MLKQGKIDLVTKLTPKLKNSSCLIFVNFAGLSVTLQQKLKRELKEIGADMTVIKNTLIKRAGKEAGLPDEILNEQILSGQTALILSEGDSIAPIQVIGKFAKENNVPQFKVGIIDGNLQDKEALLKISILPTKDVLFSQVVGSLISPMYGLTNTLQGNLQKLIYILKSKAGD
ncbi:50S ribosomal protein L10 [Candidatus Woesebacteria bacterium GWC2_33_12]|uniref:Large ribosomal subunit protein uL10 n=1 Tax=Candidatus Woesebacteria bacterium GW2011_GWB1_33_22 TaxID=1618566 RepID=A0A0F9ZM71_9BACT|nr:MAG: 50S ribosomal protein L10 [Candidatus Woesebacteria bacterium GW2011_GWC2_33_12]KKP42605.1 MAG: 50S ribosomal protein L10 [Candidatus Woesebacteria bacterium GW2011_GWA2_33_20]KKP45348.1 MAG: 50S ribosomal protein L10 [Candidatus Woesebacteria bacterium GW2011_GWB1_33_22]KKP47176.1 MAG: 50S ribosomal protein L10 [Microgenomates group bacterium GW2011_GWC1_33_28]KKP51018.1 MAG: 50S ribosomal protein L10 [Candidatus Woesebacteria bacterium GW2011_GWA1_33_33]OGM07233.1 MAG: 50S ribosomal 